MIVSEQKKEQKKTNRSKQTECERTKHTHAKTCINLNLWLLFIRFEKYSYSTLRWPLYE